MFLLNFSSKKKKIVLVSNYCSQIYIHLNVIEVGVSQISSLSVNFGNTIVTRLKKINHQRYSL